MKAYWNRYLIFLFTLALIISIAIKAVAIPAIPQVKRDTVQLVNLAKQFYLNEQYLQAISLWQQAITDFRQQEDLLNQGMALSNLALTQQKLGDLTAAKSTIASSVELVQSQSPTTTQQRILANSLDVQGSIARSQGESKTAFETWQQAGDIYQDLDISEAIIKNQLNQAQALQDLGYYRRANKIISLVRVELDHQPDSLNKVAALFSFGNTLRATGNLEQSLMVLRDAAKITEELNANEQQNLVLLSLGNTIRALGNRVDPASTIKQVNLAAPECLAADSLVNPTAYYLQAADCYQQVSRSPNLKTKTKAQLNLLSLIIQEGDRVADSQSIDGLIADIKTNLNGLTIGRSTIYDRLNLVQSLICLQPNTIAYPSPLVQSCPIGSRNNTISWADIEAEINLAQQQAQQIQDKSAIVYANGYLGAVYQQTRRLNQATQLTQQALLTTDSNTAPENAYLWQWQLGRIYQLQNRKKAAIQAYNSAFASLQTLRVNLVAINPEIQFAFRDRLEPLYRERVALLLANNPSQSNLVQARDTIEALQLAQLNNFFREACIDAQPQNIEQIDAQAAVIYSIILSDRLATILSQPGQPLRYYQTKIALPQIDRIFGDLYANLSPFLAITEPLKPNQTFYDWLIRPLEAQLKQNHTETLVFVLDGIMGGLPVGALHDGKRYLIEKYNLALTPGLQLLTSRSLSPQTIETVAAGVSEARQGFNSLPNVASEVAKIASLVPTELLLDRNFTQNTLREQITTRSHPIVHLATHGQFSSRAEDTFLLTWNDRINVKDLDRLLQDRDFTRDTPIELLILSACQTATGDKQAALGLAGVAVRSGARSTIATLWSIQDDSTAELMTQFYQAIKNPGIGKAEALRQAQLKLLRSPKYQHPYYWSAFVLVGNWL